MLWAVACTAFFGFFRLGELLPESTKAFDPRTGITWGDVSVDSYSAPTMFQIYLIKSKCDQFGVGSDIVLGATFARSRLSPTILSIEAAGWERSL